MDAHVAYQQLRIDQARPRWIPATVLLRELRELGYEGGISQLKAWLAPLKQVVPEPLVRFETAPGKQMQADFTYIRRGRDPLMALVATMGYSRASYVKFSAASGESSALLCDGLGEAFDYFGGVPEHVLFDNTKAVVIERDAYGEGNHRWNSDLRELGERCGFIPKLCKPYRAQTKGKVERFNSYLKSSFVVPLAASLEASGLRFDVQQANFHVRRWLDDVANARVHATTKAVPEVRLAEERAVMLPAPALKAPPPVIQRVAMPLKSLQHPLAVYDALLEMRK